MTVDDDNEHIELVASAGELDPVIQTLRQFLHRSGALRAVAVVDAEPAAIVDVGRLLPIEVQAGDRVMHLPHAIELDAQPLADVDVRQLPPFDVDVDELEIRSTIGGVEHVAGAVRTLAEALGGRSVAMAQFETSTPGVPFSVTARAGEPIVLAIGDQEAEMDPGWP